MGIGEQHAQQDCYKSYMTIDEIVSRKEDQTFDCKSIQIGPKALAVPIVAMANADGLIAIGVLDKTRRIEGINVKEFGEGIDRICNELESRGTVVPTFHTDAFILKATLKAEFVDENRECGETDVPINVSLNVPLNTKNLAERMGVGKKTMQRELNWLQEQGTIRWVGAKKNGHWEIVNKQSE